MSLVDHGIVELKTQESWKSTTLAGLAAASILPFSLNVAASAGALSVDAHKHYVIQIESSAVSFVTKLEIPTEDTKKPTFRPKTALGERLQALRSKAIGDGMRLLSADEVVEEVMRRRGEID